VTFNMAQQAAAADDEKKQDGSQLRDQLIDILAKSQVSSLKISNNVVILDSKTDPKKGIEILLENKIRAAPVIEANKFIGVLDLRDTVKFVVESYESAAKKEKKLALEYLTGSPQITSNTLKYLCQMRAFRTVRGTDSLLDVAKVLAAGSHIVGVVDGADGDAKQSKLVGILSQGSLFQQVASLWMAGPLKEAAVPLLQELIESKYITSPVKSVSAKLSALSAFEQMSKLDLSGLAVVDDDGVLIHNTSATDIKLWLSASEKLNMSIEAFLIQIRKASLDERYPVTMCTAKDSLKRAIEKLKATKYHRMWIVDAEKKPIGVLALTDIFKFVCKTKEQ